MSVPDHVIAIIILCRHVVCRLTMSLTILDFANTSLTGALPGGSGASYRDNPPCSEAAAGKQQNDTGCTLLPILSWVMCDCSLWC